MRSYNTYCFQSVFHYFLNLSSCLYIKIDRYTHRLFLHSTDILYSPFNHSFIDRTFSFFHISLLERTRPLKALYVNLLHRTSPSVLYIPRSGTDGLKLYIYNSETVLPLCPIFTPTNVYQVSTSTLNPCQVLTLFLIIAYLMDREMATHFKFFPICLSSSVKLSFIFLAQEFFLLTLCITDS